MVVLTFVSISAVSGLHLLTSRRVELNESLFVKEGIMRAVNVDVPDVPADVEAWIKDAEHHEGSWWPYWHQWLYRKSGSKVPARIPGDGALDVIEDAPGRYVKGN